MQSLLRVTLKKSNVLLSVVELSKMTRFHKLIIWL